MPPYLSIVVAARNDNYGGDFLRRMQLFLSTLATLSDRHHLKAELIIVEWNPPADRPRLLNVVEWPDKSNGLTVRMVTVPESVHRTMPNSEKMPLFEYIAKNVGIRRAQGDFILVTNPDIIFSDGAVAYLARGNLLPDCFYCADRYDLRRTIPANIPVDNMLQFCNRHFVMIHKWNGPQVRRVSVRNRFKKVSVRVKSAWVLWALLVKAFLSRPSPLRLVRWIFRGPRNPHSTKETPVGVGRVPLHLGAPGDFLLMDRQQWHRLRGFPELPTHSFIDYYLVYMASAAGLKQRTLPHPIYHQEHDRAEHAVRPLTMLDTLPAFKEMIATGKPVVINGRDWGMGDLRLTEHEMDPLNGDTNRSSMVRLRNAGTTRRGLA